jgi:hypothetical protein
MFSAAIINYVLGFATTVTFMFNVGANPEDLIDPSKNPSGQPWVAVMLNITGSKPAVIVLIIVMIVLVSHPARLYASPSNGQTNLLTSSTSSAPSTKSPPAVVKSTPSPATRDFPSTLSSPASSLATACPPTPST